MNARRRSTWINLVEQSAQIQARHLCPNLFRKILDRPALQQFCASDNFIQRTESQICQYLSHFLRNTIEEGNYVFRFTTELESQFFLLRRHTHRTRIEMTHAEHRATRCD